MWDLGVEEDKMGGSGKPFRTRVPEFFEVVGFS
jgi:hypothetical protein